MPAVVSHLAPTGRLPASARLNLAIGLAPRDTTLDKFIAQLYDPASTIYHRFLTPAQFTARFGPTEKEYQSLIEYAQASGWNVTRQYSNRVVLDVDAPVAAVEKALHVTMLTYQSPTEARTFYAPDVEPSVPASLPVLHIAGLDNSEFPHSMAKRPLPGAQAMATPYEGSAPGAQLWGNDFRNAYVPGTTLTGTGQSVGLLEFDGFYPTDVANYETGYGLSVKKRPPLVVVPIDGGVTNVSTNNSEVAGDIEMVVSMAPGVKTIYVFEDGLRGGSILFDDIFESMVSYTNILQFSCSWGDGSAQDLTAEVLFKQLDAQGQCFFQASGDSGAFVGPVKFPSDSPSIVQVGGTTLTDGSSPSYPWAGEVVWAWHSGSRTAAASAVSSGGGISTYYPIPSWQTNIIMTTNLGSTLWRNVPDVSANADNVYLCYDNGTKQGGWGGTSFAAPLWAGFTALVNQRAAANGNPPVGFLNPALYSLAAGSNYTNLFHDVTTGNDSWEGSGGKFYAAPGYDLCCGLGSMTGTNLIAALVGQPAAPPFFPPVAKAASVSLSWPTLSGVWYQLQYTSDLTGAAWTNLGGPTQIDGTVATASDSITNTQRFYRVLTLP